MDRRSPVRSRQLASGRGGTGVQLSNPVGLPLEAQSVAFAEARGVRIRPWSFRWSSPIEMDAMAAAAGLALAGRWESFAGERFDADSPRQVSAYARAVDREETSSAAAQVLG